MKNLKHNNRFESDGLTLPLRSRASRGSSGTLDRMFKQGDLRMECLQRDTGTDTRLQVAMNSWLESGELLGEIGAPSRG